MSNFSQVASTSVLFWVTQKVSAVAYVWDGYQVLNEAVLWGNHCWGSSPEQQACQRRLLPRPLTSWMVLLTDVDYLRSGGPTNQNAPLATHLANQDLLNREDILRLINDACVRHGLSRTHIHDALRLPSTAVRLAYRFTRIAARSLGLSSPEVALSLLLLRISSIPLLRKKQCELCFRVAFPGEERCQSHSRSKSLNFPHAIQDARAARKIIEKSADLRNQAKRLTYVGDRIDAVAGAIFLLPVKVPYEWHLNVQLSLQQCPLVRQLLSVSPALASPLELLLDLKRALDPDEWKASGWPNKIYIAERWLEMIRTVAPGGPPKGANQKTRQLIEKARDLLGQGFDTAEVARQLGVSRANLYKSLSRYNNLI